MSYRGEKAIEPDLNPSQSKDYFISHPPFRPKKDIADYWESKGKLTPRRFDTLEAALLSGNPFIIRSEHPQDYDSTGVPGLLDSFPISPIRIANAKKVVNKDFKNIKWNETPMSGRDINSAEVIAQVGEIDQEQLEAKLKELSERKIARYLQLTGIDRDAFLREISYSYWEYLGGINRTIVADSTVHSKYYIFGSSTDNYSGKDLGSSYHVLEDGEISRSKTTGGLVEDIKDLRQSTELYESLRNLDGFDPNHCPIIEAQSLNGQHFPLQYHRARDFHPATHRLEREKTSEEQEATFVRGSTPQEGTVFDVNVYTRDQAQSSLLSDESALDFNLDQVHTGAMASRRKLQLVVIDDVLRLGIMLNGRHMTTSQLFKPEITIGVEDDSLPKRVYSRHADGDNKLTVKVVSDGRRAFLKQLA